jgi:hypothetical protein
VGSAEPRQQPPQQPSAPTRDEVVHTTATHPWLTADHGWQLASFLHLGEPVARVDGTTATVVAVRAVPGAAAMWDLTVSTVHTFAVGTGRYVVHNCGSGGSAGEDPRKGLPGEDANAFEKEQGAQRIKETPEFKEKYGSDYQWDYQGASGPDRVGNELDHEARYNQRYYFSFYDNGWGEVRQISANFDPIAREWEEAAFHFASGKW